MRNPIMKKLICLLLVLVLTFSSTLALYTEDVGRVVEEIDYAEAYPVEDEVPPAEEPAEPSEPVEPGEPGEEPVEPGEPTTRVPGINIVRAQVTIGGQYQALWRSAELWDVSRYTVYPGDCDLHATNGENPANWYTTARMVNLQDPRRFTLEIVVPLGDFTGIAGTENAGANPFDLANVTITYTSGPGNGTQTLVPAQTTVSRAVIDGNYIVIDAAVTTAHLGNNTATANNRAFAGAPDVGRGTAAIFNRIGEWPLRVNYTGEGVIAEKMLRTSLNDSIQTWGEVNAWAQELATEFPNGTTTLSDYDRFFQVENYGRSHQGRDLFAFIIADSAASVDRHLTETVPLMNSDPAAMQQAILDGTFDHRGVIMISANHGNEVQANGIIPELIDRLLNFEEVRFPVRDTAGTRWLPPTTMTAGAAGTRVGVDPNTPNDALNRDHIYTEVLCIDELLEHYIIVMQFWTNPDGNVVPVRANRFGQDPNRDGGQFNFMETQYSIAYQNKWDPIYFAEIHDLVRTFQNDGCTPPIEPSLEADLIDDFMVCLLEAMGYAALGNSFQQFNIPMRDRVHDWDAGTLIYSAAKTMMNGSLGSTLEFPTTNQDAIDSGVAGFFGLFRFMVDNFAIRDGARPNDAARPINSTIEVDEEEVYPGLYWNKLEFKRRGVENVDAIEYVDPLLTFIDWRIEARRNLPVAQGGLPFTLEPNQQMSRPRQVDANGDTLSFFPEYWVIPVDRSLQYSPVSAANAMELLQRLGHVEIYVTTARVVGADGYIYPAGSYVVPMHQARRSFAHSVLYDGYDTARFGGRMYDAQTIVSWPAQRGFNAIATWQTGLFDGITERVNVTNRVDLPGTGEFVIYQNSGLDAIRLTNRLLDDGRDVWMTTSYIPGAEVGDFIARRDDVAYMVGPHHNVIWYETALTVFAIDGGNTAPTIDVATPLVQPRLAIARPPASATSGEGALPYFMLIGGLEFSQFQAGATGPGAVWVGAGAPPNAAATLPTVMWNATAANVNAANALGAGAVVAGNPTTGGSGLAQVNAEMTGRGTWSGSSIVAPGYDAKDFLIAIGANAYINPSDDIKVLGQFVHVPGTGNTEERGSQIYLAGRRGVLRAADYSDRILAITGIRDNGTPVTAISQNILTRGRLQSMWHLVGSSVLAYAAGITDVPRPVAFADVTEAVGGVPTVAPPATLRRNQAVNLSEFAANIDTYIHWFAENSDGVSSQGTFGPFTSGTVNLTALAQDTAGIAPGVTLDEFKFVMNNNAVQPAFVSTDETWQDVPADGNIVVPGITWTSSNPTLVTISANGLVTVRGNSGNVTLTARDGNGQVITSILFRLTP